MRTDIGNVEMVAKAALDEEGSFGWSHGGREIACVPSAMIEMATAIRRLEIEHDTEVYRVAKHAFIAGAQNTERDDRERDFDTWWDDFLARRKRHYP